MASNYPQVRRIETVADVRVVLDSDFAAAFQELLDCIDVARAAGDLDLVERAGTELLQCTTGKPKRALPSLRTAAQAIVATYLAGATTLDDLGPRVDLAMGALEATGARTVGEATRAIDESRRWLDELRLLYSDATAPSLVQLCSKLRDIDRADLGVEAATRAIAIDGESAPALTTRAAALLDQGNHPRAMTDIRRAWALRPTAYVANAYSRILLAAGHPDEALEKAEEAFRMSPDVASSHALLAAAAAASNDDAMARAKDLIKTQSSEEADGGSLWVETLAARALLDAGQLDEAEAAINQLVNDPGAPGAQVRQLLGRLKFLRRQRQQRFDI